ncbi:hypothetical protein DL546_004959 [Coniochaeta pulveracea]|uniref:Uncharacterized protein n=1 Tax=Coniochaeta pulveracea TaxID=177199 RepID=A0A420YCF5_9PEZI|nr:hypothetical protein DL546_004959 [Coniochaeta pulveracea]
MNLSTLCGTICRFEKEYCRARSSNQPFRNLSAVQNATRRTYSDSPASAKPEERTFESYFENSRDERHDASRHFGDDQHTPGSDVRPVKEFSIRRVSYSASHGNPSTGALPHRRRLTKKQDVIINHKGQRLKQTAQDLPIDILGKPGHAIVLRDVGPAKRRMLQQLIEEEKGKEQKSSNLDEQLSQICESAEQPNPPSSDEVLRNIDELKPARSVIPRRDFNVLKKKLSDGFTKSQLATYITTEAAKDTVKRRTDRKTGKGSRRPWIVEESAWTPENHLPGSLDALMTGYLSKNPSPKERLVVGLLRRCWNLSVEELQKTQGFLDVVLKETQFELLLLGNRRWLDSISRSLLEANTQIELIRAQRIVRVVAPKATAEYIINEICAILDKAAIRKLDATNISLARLEDSVLEEVGRMTHTVVQATSRGRIQVSWLPVVEPTKEGLEDLGDVVHRLLRSGYGFQHHGQTTTSVFPDPHTRGGWYLIDYHSKMKMGWKDRLADWGRWTIATPRLGTKAVATCPAIPDTIVSHPFETSSSPSTQADGWLSQPQATTRAIFGHVLHKEPPAQSYHSTESKHTKQDDTLPTDQLKPDLDRTLVPIIPPLTSIAALTAQSKHTTPSDTTIVMRFLPISSKPSPKPSSSIPMPSLELILSSDPSTPEDDLTISSLRATTSVSTHDILLPSQPVDIRLVHTTSYTLPGSNVPDHLPQVVSFLQASDLRPSDGVLVTPPRFAKKLRLPARLVGTTEDLEVEYMFAGLEMRRSVSTEVDGWKLAYTSVEAGQGGGRRAELALEGKRMDGSPSKIEDFVQTLNKLTLDGGLKWYGEAQRPVADSRVSQPEEHREEAEEEEEQRLEDAAR